MTSILLYKGIRDDQTKARQAKAGRFYTTDRESAGYYGDVIECRVVEFKRLCSASNPASLAETWGKDADLDQMRAKRDLLWNSTPHHQDINHNRWPAYHACFYILDKVLAKAARHRGYDGIHYKWWHTYAKL